MKIQKIETINLLKLYVIILSSIIISIFFSIIIALIFYQNLIFYFILSFALSLSLIYFSKSYSKKSINIIINEDDIILGNNISIQFRNIKLIEYKCLFRNYPFLKIETFKNEIYKIRSSSKVNQNLENLISIIQKKINT